MSGEDKGSSDSGELDLTIFVACLNEEKLVTQTLKDIIWASSFVSLKYEVLVYDDGSTDATADVVGKFIRENRLESNFFLISNDVNAGVGINYFRAAERGRGKYFIGISGDNGEPAQALKRIFELIGKSDIIVPHFDTRLFDMAFNGDNRPFRRRFISVLYAKIVRYVSGHNLHYFNACIVHKRENVLKNRVVTSGLGYNAELLCRVLNEPEITFIEVKVHNKDREYGITSAFKPRNITAVVGSLFRILKNCRFSGRRKSYRSIQQP